MTIFGLKLKILHGHLKQRQRSRIKLKFGSKTPCSAYKHIQAKSVKRKWVPQFFRTAVHISSATLILARKLHQQSLWIGFGWMLRYVKISKCQGQKWREMFVKVISIFFRLFNSRKQNQNFRAARQKLNLKDVCMSKLKCLESELYSRDWNLQDPLSI